MIATFPHLLSCVESAVFYKKKKKGGNEKLKRDQCGEVGERLKVRTVTFQKAYVPISLGASCAHQHIYPWKSQLDFSLE